MASSDDPWQKSLSLDDYVPGKVNARLEKILSLAGDENLVTKLDHFALGLHTMMLEVGFEVTGDESRVLDVKNWRSNDASVYKFSYTLPGGPTMSPCTLKLFRVGVVLCVVGNFHGNPATSRSFSNADENEYIGPIESNKKPESRFLDTKSLSRSFKNSVALPLLSIAKQQAGRSPGKESILCLPDEVLRLVLSHSGSPVDICRSMRTCSRLEEICKSNSIWKNLFSRDFSRKFDEIGDDVKASPETVWYNMYRDEAVRKRRVKSQERRFNSNFRPPPPMPHYPHPPPPRGPFQPRGGFNPPPFWEF